MNAPTPTAAVPEPQTTGGLTRRIIPCLDVTDGRVVKGVHFVDLRDAGDPVELAAFYDREGRRRTGLPRHHRVERRPPHGAGPGRADGRRRCSSRSPSAAACASVADMRALLAAGADKVSINTRRGGRSGADHGGAPRLRPPVHRRRHRRPADRRPRRRAGRSSPTAAARATGLDAVAWARAAAERGAGEILLTSMDRDGTRRLRPALTAAVAAAVPVPVIASGGAGALAAPGRRAHRGGPTPPSPPRSSTSARPRSAKPSASWRRRACRSA